MPTRTVDEIKTRIGKIRETVKKVLAAGADPRKDKALRHQRKSLRRAQRLLRLRTGAKLAARNKEKKPAAAAAPKPAAS